MDVDIELAKKLVERCLREKYGHDICVKLLPGTLRNIKKGEWEVRTLKPLGCIFRISSTLRGTPYAQLHT